MEIVVGIIILLVAMKWIGNLNPLNAGCGCISTFIIALFVLGLLMM